MASSFTALGGRREKFKNIYPIENVCCSMTHEAAAAAFWHGMAYLNHDKTNVCHGGTL